MKKLLMVLLIVAAAQFTAKAQDEEGNKFAFSVGPELVIPARSAYSIGYGASAKVEIPVAGKFVATATGAYQSMVYKTAFSAATGGQPNGTFVPLKAGAQYSAGTGVYLEAEFGDVIETSTNAFGTKRNLFVFAFGPGFLIKLTDKQKIDLGFRYEQWADGVLQETTIRVGYRVNF